MPGGFEVREPPAPREGIPVRGNGDPEEPAYVVARDRKRFEAFCANSGVNPGSPRVKFIPAHSRLEPARLYPGVTSVIEADDCSWAWVVFVGVNPSSYGDMSGPDWYALERRRNFRQFTRAWHYDHLWITPNVTAPQTVEEMFDQWDNDF